MKVEVLYVADCPTHPAAVRLVKRVLAAEGVETEIHEVLVSDAGMASELGFCGSPTIRNRWTRCCGGVEGRSEFRAELPFVFWIETGRPSTSGDGSSGSA